MVDHTFPQDGDYDEAASFAQWGDHASFTDYVEHGLSLSVDHANDNFDVTAGKAFISHPSETGAKSGETRDDVSYSVYADARTGIAAADATVVNYIWLDVRLDDDDVVEITPTTSDSPPSHGSGTWEALKIGRIDFGSAGTEPVEVNRGIEATADSIAAGSGDNIGLSGDSFEGAGFDEVDVPQTLNLTVEDWESGALDTTVWTGDTASYEVQSSTVQSGNYAVKGSVSGGGSAGLSSDSGLGSYVQAGDTFEFHTYITETDTRHGVSVLKNGSTYIFVELQTDNDRIKLSHRISGTFNDTFADADLSNHLNEWLKVTLKISEDATDARVALVDNSGYELASVERTQSDFPVTSGSIRLAINQNSSTAATGYFDELSTERREPEARTDTAKGTTQLGNEVTPSGSIHTGPQEAPLNAERAQFARAPANDDATAGTQSLLTLLDSAGVPAAYVERVLDGEGGAYANQLQGALGRFARINANLSWEYETLADVPNWSSADGGVSTWTFNVNSRPRRIHVEHDGSGGSDDFGGVIASLLTTFQTLGGFRINFQDVSFTDANEDNLFVVGVGDTTPDTGDLGANGNGIYYRDAPTTTDSLNTVVGSNGSSFSFSDLSWSSNHDIIIEYDGVEARLLIDGVEKATASFSTNVDYRPVLQVKEDAANSSAETAEVEQVTVEPLPEVLQ